MTELHTEALMRVAKDHCRSAIDTITDQNGGLSDALAAIEAAQCALTAAHGNLTRHLKG